MDAAGLTFESGDSIIVTAADGMSLTYSYAELIGTARAYYSDIFSAYENAVSGTAVEPMFVLKGNMASSGAELTSMVSDTLNAYRFVFGQSAEELAGRTKIVDRMPKSVESVTLVKAPSHGGGTDYDGDVNGNGKVNNFDAELVVEIYKGYWPEDDFSVLTALIRSKADVNGDKTVDLNDVRAIWAIITD